MENLLSSFSGRATEVLGACLFFTDRVEVLHLVLVLSHEKGVVLSAGDLSGLKVVLLQERYLNGSVNSIHQLSGDSCTVLKVRAPSPEVTVLINSHSVVMVARDFLELDSYVVVSQRSEGLRFLDLATVS